MKKLATTVAAIALIGTPAFAADIAVKAPPPAPAPVYNWTGWYVGGNLGASFGNVKTDFNVAPYSITGGDALATFPGIGVSDRTSPSGFMGGGQIGYNWQVSPIWVVGFEADFQGAAERDSNYLTTPFTVPITLNGSPSGLFATGTAVTDYTTQIDWFGTVRGRIGYVWGNGDVLSYVTGGLAYGQVKINGTNTTSGNAGGVPFSVTQAFGHSQVNTGWVLGYGTEGKLLIPGWTYKIESLYMDLGHLDAAGVTSAASIGPGFPGFTFTGGGQLTTHSHFADGILRAGLNYKFN